MKVTLAKTAGFCFGVSRAVKLAEQAAEAGPCCTLGPLIHNKSVTDMLASKGVREIEDVSQVCGGTVVIRSHGIGRAERERLEAAGAEIIDATCPDVAKIHKIVSRESDEGRQVVIIGQRNHPEVLAICGWCRDPIVFETAAEVGEWLKKAENREKLLSVVSQTTGKRDNFELSVNLIKKECTNSKIFDTICNTTFNRQKEAAKLASENDAMIVIGGAHSANSRHLADICRQYCGKVLFVETADGLKPWEFDGVDTVGITAGASTPAWIIKEVYNKMSEEVITMEGTESFEELLEKSIKTLHTGEKVTGVVAAITPTEISVDLGTKQSGYIPVSELSDDPLVKAEDIVKVGDEIETYVMRVNDVEGTVMLSKKRLDSAKNWELIMAAKDDKTVMEGIVLEDNRGGVVVSVKGVRVFVPASQTGLPKDAPMSDLVKSTVRLCITEVNQSRKRVVGSIRAAAYEERKEKAEKVWNEIEEGKRYKGVVKSLTSYGAFVDIGGVDGMVHVSELSWLRIRQPSDVVKVGDEIEVYVISFDKEKRKISLGYKDPEANPWVKFTSAYSVGDVVAVKVVKLMQFGAFAEILPGVDGLIHISQIANRRIGKPDEVLSEGETVTAKITAIEEAEHKVSLSIRALSEAPAPEPAQEPEEPPASDESQASDEPSVVYDTDHPTEVHEDAE